MITAHAPAGYAVSKLAVSLGLIPDRTFSPRTIIGIGVCAALLPDLDLIYFLTIDARQHLHHSYWTHIPFFWLVAFSGIIAWCYALRCRHYIPLVALVGVNVLLHCFLDTIVAGIRWLEPFSHRYVVFFAVPNVYPYTLLNFMLHWTFGLEVLVWVVAIGLYAWTPRKHAVHDPILRRSLSPVAED